MLNNRILIVDDNQSIHLDFEKALSSHHLQSIANLTSLEQELFPDDEELAPKEVAQIDYILDSAFQGEEAYEKVRDAEARGEPYALVFMDVRMPPGWNGIETSQKILADFPNIEIVLCSAYSDYSWDDIVEILGQTDRILFLRKPFDPIAVKQMALAITKKWELHAENRMKTKELMEARRLAEAADRQKSQFLSNISHEIRTPLNGILGMANLLGQFSLDPEYVEYLASITDSANILLELFNDLIDFSKMEAGNLALDVVDFNLRSLVDDVCLGFEHRFDEKGISLEQVHQPGMPRFYTGDPRKLRQLLQHYLSNALKFTDKGSVLVSVSLEGKTIVFNVKDSGIGIPEEMRHHLFKWFSQVDGSASRKYGGSGLGLVICQKLSKIMNGQTGFSSEPGQGSEFWFKVDLPVVLDENLPRLQESTGLQNVPILYLQRFPHTKTIMEKAFGGSADNFTTVSTEAEAVKALKDAAKDNPYKIFLVEADIPPLKNRQLSEEILKNPELKGLHSMVLAASAFPGDASLLKEQGYDGLLVHPLEPETIKNAAASMISRDEATSNLVTRHSIADAKINKARLIMAEDNLVNQKVMVKLLKKFGYECDVVINGQELLEVLKDSEYDLILMDCQMPVMDGFEATRQIRQCEGEDHIPIIAVTANVVEADRHLCFEAGMDDYIPKPVRKDKLIETIEHWLRKNAG